MPEPAEKLTSLLRRRKTIVVAVLIVLVAGGLWAALGTGGGHRHKRPQAQPPSTGGAPATGFDLSGWKLTIPEADDDGGAAQINPAEAKAPWMVPDGGGGFTFWAPSQGATTEHSEHPRTELNSLTNFKAGQGGRHELRASVTVQQEPKDGQGIIIGQIHGADDISSVPYVMVRYQNHGLIAVVKQVQDGNDHVNYPVLKDLPLNTRFDFTIADRGDGNMEFTGVSGGQQGHQVVPVPQEFRGATVRFQAGDYQQADDPAGAQDGGRVVFHALDQASNKP